MPSKLTLGDSEVSISDMAGEKQLIIKYPAVHGVSTQTEPETTMQAWRIHSVREGLPCKPQDVSLSSGVHIKEIESRPARYSGGTCNPSPGEADRQMASQICKYQASEQHPRNRWLCDLYTHAMILYPQKHTKL